MAEEKTSIEKSLKKTDAVTVDEASRASAVVEKAVAADPALLNELNREPWWQSGVMWFGTGGVLWALGTLFSQFGVYGLNYEKYNYSLIVGAVGSLISAIGVLWRRFYPGLKPLFWRWTHPLETK